MAFLKREKVLARQQKKPHKSTAKTKEAKTITVAKNKTSVQRLYFATISPTKVLFNDTHLVWGRRSKPFFRSIFLSRAGWWWINKYQGVNHHWYP